MPIRIDEVDSYQALAGMGDIWERLLDSSPDDDVFLTHEWLTTWWRNYGQGRKMMVLVAWEGSDMTGLAPLMITPLGKVLKLNVLEFIGTGQSDRLSILATRGREAALSSMWRYVQERKGWDALDLRDMTSWGSSCLHFRENFPGAAIEESSSPCLSLQGSFPAYVASLSGNFRHSLTRSVALMREELGAEFVTHHREVDMHECLRTLIRLNALRWRNRGASVLESETFQTFLADVLPRLARKGWVRYHTLAIGEEPFAISLGFYYKNRYMYYLSGFDPEYQKYGPGRTLLFLTIEEAYRNGLSEVDFMRGDEQYKYRFNPEDRKLVRGTFTRGGVKGAIISSARK